MVMVCKFVLQGVQNNFFFINIIYIYIYNFWLGGSFEHSAYNILLPLQVSKGECPLLFQALYYVKN